MGHLTKLQEEYGKKGLHVLALTGEDKTMNLRYMVHNDPGFGYKVGIQGGGAYGVSGIPHAYLIDVEGKVVWEGSPSSLPKKVLQAELKRVEPPAQEVLEERAQKQLEFAEKYAEDRQFLRAEMHFEKVVDEYKGTRAVETAEKRIKEMKSGDNKAEYDAQAKIAKLVGGIEQPNPSKKKLKSKKIESAAKKLTKMAEDFAESAPRAAQLAAEWADIFGTKWK